MNDHPMWHVTASTATALSWPASATISTTNVPLPGGWLYGGKLRKVVFFRAEEDTDGTFVVSHAASDVYGHGATRAEAVADFREALVRTREVLEAEEHRLSSRLQRQLAYLRHILKP